MSGYHGRVHYWCTCYLAHSEKDEHGKWRFGADEVLELLIMRSGKFQFRAVCQRCGCKSNPLPHSILSHFETITRIRRPEYSQQPSPCAYSGCFSDGVEWHHFAPCNTFEDADNWPVAPLCPAHHNEWHAKMDGYRRTARARR